VDLVERRDLTLERLEEVIDDRHLAAIRRWAEDSWGLSVPGQLTARDNDHIVVSIDNGTSRRYGYVKG
jgi:hypothetical protein